MLLSALVGLCGGATVAAAAAFLPPERVGV